jgi:hypothetical protein
MGVVAPVARLVAFSAFDKTLIRRAMTAVGVSAYISKSGDIREVIALTYAGCRDRAHARRPLPFRWDRRETGRPRGCWPGSSRARLHDRHP